jgi:hypothetical protein
MDVASACCGPASADSFAAMCAEAERRARPSTLRSPCPSFPTGAETHFPSGMMDDLDPVDEAFVVTGLSRQPLSWGCVPMTVLRLPPD